MSLNKSILAAAIGMSAACGATQTPAPHPEQTPPTVMVAPVKRPDSPIPDAPGSPKNTRVNYRKELSANDNPIIVEQQKIMECILQVDAFLFMDCMDEMAKSADCYNAGLEKIVNENKRYPQCREAIRVRPQSGEEREITENKCLDRVLVNKPHKLDNLVPCFAPQKACFEKLIKDSSIVCTAEEEDARLYNKP